MCIFLLAPDTSGASSSPRQDFHIAAVSLACCWATSWGILLAPHPSNHYVSSPSLSLASLIGSPSPFTSGLKPCQCAPQALGKDPLSPLRKLTPIWCQQAWCCVCRPMVKEPKVVVVTWVTEPFVNRLSLPTSFNYCQAVLALSVYNFISFIILSVNFLLPG